MDNRQRLILEMLARADARLEAQQQIALASDARAMQLVGVLIAAAAVTTAIGEDAVSAVQWAIVVPLVLAAAAGIYAARPVGWYAPGMRPSAFNEDLDDDRDLADVQLELARHLEACIEQNSEILRHNADALRTAVLLAACAPVLGAIASIAV
ncbi:hypothetical protein G5V65_21055 [Rhodobacter sp. HX-7-19]|uniref:Uncharacterized protein n=1 Tax=Paragemmobacter kunshanensis TaxID=2583234 RepID=A0A6M1TSS5_9RHOB|nr:hypothetical protein [Rhodobacter kunshanensis]NGQ93379.1 hypothetical protein [Rhodobacter kunshanensis]